MYVLGIETSCDETSAAVVKNGRKILSCVVSSSLKFHKKYGGVVPEIASRMQLETITQVTDTAVKEAGVRLRGIDLISVTSGPGLLGSLLVGISFAKAISISLEIPLLEVDHIYGHIYANFLWYRKAQNTFLTTENRRKSSPKAIFLNGAKIKLPFIGLVVSGGHTSLFYVRDFKKIETLGQTLDDACGEAFDKVAKILGLGYPGGPLIEKLAKGGDERKIKFRCSGTTRPLDFSFSGIKTAVLYLVNGKRLPAARLPDGQGQAELTLNDKQDIAASFQETVINTLIQKSLLACKFKKINRLVIGGGVVSNNRLRERFLQEAKKEGVSLFFPSQELCLDNAAMVAGLGYWLFKPRQLNAA